MASLSKTYTQEKLLGQIYTPSFIVKKILDDVGYQGVSILGKTIIDPACGDGQFLQEIVRRIIQVSPKKDLFTNLRFVYGWDIDVEAIEKCITNLNQLIGNENQKIDWNIQQIDWQIKTENALKKIKQASFQSKGTREFDFIVGNPPYIRIQHLELSERKYIKTHYQFCKSGSTDIYIAFFELCFGLLKNTGVCGLITPNTFLYTETAKIMRSYFAKSDTTKKKTLLKQITQLRKITNYGTIQLFDNATTYSAITIFSKQANESFVYELAIDENTFQQREIPASEIVDKSIWQLSIQGNQKINGKRLGEICNIHVGITTLCDKAYIFSNISFGKKICSVYSKQINKEIKLETSLLKPIIKASTYKRRNSIKEYILFPYQKDENQKYQIIPEDELRVNFPYAYAYLISIKSTLNKRDNGKPNPIAWYAFGRNQGLDTSFGKKIIFSPMNKEPNFIYSDNEEATLYSGYLIKYQGDADKLIQQLNSARMKDFVAISSRDFRGGYKAYNKKVIENFVIDIEELG